MSTDLIPFAGTKPAAAFQAALGGGVEQESLSDGIGSSYAVVGYKGKVWTLRHRGEKHIFTRPDDGTPAAHIDVIILRQGRTKSKSYYEKYDPNTSEGQRPICASLNGVVPDADVLHKQSDACAVCPRNVWKTNAEGKKSRECTDYKRLAVLVLPNQTQRMFGAPLMEPAFLRVPPASLNDLGVYGDQLNAQGYHYAAVATRITFDPTQPHPKMVFRGLQALTDGEAPVVLPMREDPLTLRITGEDMVAAIQGAANPLALTTQHRETPQPMLPTAQPVASPKPSTVPSEPPATALGLQQYPGPKPEGTNSMTKSPSSGLLDLAANAPAKAVDTGAASESDEALDALIKNALQS